MLLLAFPSSLFLTIFFSSSKWLSVIVIALSTFDNAEVTYFVHSLADSAVAVFPSNVLQPLLGL